ncbi:hypothetical protein ES332_D12G011100v1 [Gossypium tomentosum]|uniref:Uncharacterized protein n=1 Tax=Gossypium tomentosum TaxID=34277 RepID=A0A5D2I3Z0_GOSTO|nr:hypothetical protein ES332_D12G011100v1 [Gossypium tomentosum]
MSDFMRSNSAFIQFTLCTYFFYYLKIKVQLITPLETIILGGICKKINLII